MDLVVLGDSVTWGQGLLDQHKFATLVAAGLNAKFPGITPAILSHSGAVIGRAATCPAPPKPPIPGEVPESCPTILQQIPTYQGDPATVPVVILDGGINDIDIRTILNPFTDPSDLASDIQQYCYRDMGYLLEQVKLRFSAQSTKIVVTSYFPILSSASDLDRLAPLLECMGTPLPAIFADVIASPVDPIVSKILNLCDQFWRQSTQWLSKCVNDVNLGTGPRCYFADAGFTADHSVFAPQAWLFGVGPEPDFAAEDEVVAQRRPQCDIACRNDLAALFLCYRASAGHPNPTGAQQYAQAILKAVA